MDKLEVKNLLNSISFLKYQFSYRDVEVYIIRDSKTNNAIRLYHDLSNVWPYNIYFYLDREPTPIPFSDLFEMVSPEVQEIMIWQLDFFGPLKEHHAV